MGYRFNLPHRVETGLEANLTDEFCRVTEGVGTVVFDAVHNSCGDDFYVRVFNLVWHKGTFPFNGWGEG